MNDNKAQVFNKFINQTTVNQFTDPSFPPTTSTSVYWTAGTDAGYRTTWNAIGWKRPATAWTTNFNLWGTNGVKPLAVRQGYLGDCWWLATMAALAEWPARV